MLRRDRQKTKALEDLDMHTKHLEPEKVVEQMQMRSQARCASPDDLRLAELRHLAFQKTPLPLIGVECSGPPD